MNYRKMRLSRKSKKRVVAGFLVASLFYAMSAPQTAAAQILFEDDEIYEPIVLESTIRIGQIAEEEIGFGFPVAGERSPIRTVSVVATAYTSREAETDSTPCIAAKGFDLCAFYQENGYGNTIAANFLPIGARVRLPQIFGDKIFIVRDRMNARYGYGRVDVWLPELSEAKSFGVKRVEMEVF